MFMTRHLLFSCLLLLGSWVAMPLRADITSPRPLKAPVAKPVVIKVLRGTSTEIRLPGSSRYNRSLSFALNALPSHGTLTPAAPQTVPSPQSEMGVYYGVLTYVSNPASTATRDTFTFTCKLDGGPSSNEASVTINISDAFPKLRASQEVEYGRCILGQRTTGTFSVKNEGNAVWQATLAPPENMRWEIPAGGTFRLQPGATEKYVLISDNTVAGELHRKLQLMPDAVVTFTGRVVTPFSLVPARTLDLQWQAKTFTSSGRLQLHNQTSDTLTLGIAAPDELKLPLFIKLPALQTKELDIVYAGPSARAFEGDVIFSHGIQREAINIRSTRAPATIIALGVPSDGVLDFGAIKSEAQAATLLKQIILQNKGGESVSVTFDPPLTTFRLGATARRAASIPPGGELQLDIQPSTLPTQMREETTLLTAGPWSQRLLLTATWDPALFAVKPTSTAATNLIEAPKPMTGDTPDAADLQTKQQSIDAISVSNHGLMVVDENFDPTLPCVHVVKTLEITADSATLQWELPPGDGWQFKLLGARIYPPTGDNPIRKMWEPYPQATIKIDGRLATCHCTGLTKGLHYVFAVQTISAAGKKSSPGAPVGVMVYWHKRGWPWYFYLGIAFLVFCLIRWLIKKWQEPISASV